MPRYFKRKWDTKKNIAPGQSEPVDRGTFVREQKSKARVSRRTRKKFSLLRGIRSIRLAIRESAAGRKYVILHYKKLSGAVVKRKVAPYSYRFRNREGKRWKALYAFDFKERHIKGFYIRKIRSVERTDSNFKPLWPVEIRL